MKEIVNKVANSKLITINLEDFYPQETRILFDIKQWLFKGIVLKEKDFRTAVKNHNWSQYKNTYMALSCSADAIIPSWAYLLITANAAMHAKKIIVGNSEQLETVIFQEIIENIPIKKYKDLPIIIKGCADKEIPQTAYVQLISRLLPVAKSIMFGEACSTVPLYKKANITKK